MRLPRLLARASVRTLIWALIVIVGAVTALLRTAIGHEVVLNWMVEQADGRVAGGIEVGGIRSASLFQGALLEDIRLTTPEGRVFLSADSVSAAYRLRGLLGGDLSFTDVRAWGVVMELEWEEALEGSTLGRWARPNRSPVAREDDGGGGGPGFRFSDIRVEDATFRLRRPTDLEPDGLVRVLPGGTLALDLDIDTLGLPSLAVRGEADGGTEFAIRTFRGRLLLLRDPLVLDRVRLDGALAGSRLDLDVDALSLAQGDVTGEATVFLASDSRRRAEMALRLTDVQRDRLEFLLPWLPPLTDLSTGVDGTVDRGSSRWMLRDLTARWAGAPVRAEGAVRLAGTNTLEDLRITVDSLPVSAASTYLPAAEGKPGRVSGNIRLDGPVSRIGVLGRLGIRDRGALSTAQVDGAVSATDRGPRFTNFSVLISPLRWSLLEPWVPAVPISGSGRARVVLNGVPASGLRLQVDATRSGPGEESSRVVAQGSVRVGDGDWQVDVQGDAAPVQTEALKEAFPRLPVDGAVTASFRVAGNPDSLLVRSEVAEAEGRLEAFGTFSPRDLAGPLSAELVARSFPLGRFLAPLGDSTRVNGRLDATSVGRGAEMRTDASVRLTASNLRGVRVDSVVVESRVRSGRLLLDTARISVGGLELDGGGALGLPGLEDRRGELTVSVRADSLSGLRPAFLGPVVHARDTLVGLDREILILSGVNPDTLPLLEDITVGGSARGRVTLSGTLDDFDGEGELSLDALGYGDFALSSARLTASGRHLLSDSVAGELQLETDSIRYGDRGFASTRTRAVLDGEGTRVSTRLVRSGEEEYLAAGLVRRDGSTWSTRLDQLDLQFDSLRFALSGPAGVTVSDSAVVVETLELARDGPGPEPIRIYLDGRIPQRGSADFTAEMDGVRLERITRLLQREDLPLAGVVDLRADVTGTAADPIIQGELALGELVVGDFRADSTRAALRYADREAQVELSAFREGSALVTAQGSVPVDLALVEGVDRTLDEAMDLRATVQEVQVAPILALLEDLENVEGALSGDFTVTGTLEDPVPEGIVRLSDAAWTVGALGVRQSDVNGTFTLTRDGSVAVNARGRSGGRVDASGQVRLSPLTNPELEVELRFQGFQAVDRRDVEGAISGAVTVSGRYQRPRITGSLTVDQGTIYLEEFQRATGVVDLTDPVFLGLVEQESFILPEDRPLLSGIRNPFLDSLRVDVELAVPRNTWLRSDEMDVEIGGDLEVTYDRPRRDLVLVGELLARRGQYNLLGRTFQVQGGSVSFIGIPGINPLLDIQALAPIRRQEGGTLEIEATVEGTLSEPRVSLSSEEAGLAESDLISYLILGRPSSEITAGGGGVGAGGLGATAGATAVSVGLGTLASQLGAIAAQQSNFIDYLAVSQVGDLGLAGGDVSDSFSSTQVEVGWYFGGGDVFGAVTLRPLSTSNRRIGGARLEWQSSEQYHLEAFVEDRLLRTGAFGLGELTEDSPLSWGFAFYREWGY